MLHLYKDYYCFQHSFGLPRYPKRRFVGPLQYSTFPPKKPWRDQGRPWALLCPFLGAVWPLLGRSWAPLGQLPEKCLQQTIKTNFVGTLLHCFSRCGIHFRTKSVTFLYVYILFLLASTDNLLRRVGGQGGALQIHIGRRPVSGRMCVALVA